MDNNTNVNPNPSPDPNDSSIADSSFNSFQQTPPTPNLTNEIAGQQPVSTKPDSSTDIICILCILIPILGMLGIHDFIVNRKKEGIRHIIYMVASFLGAFMTMATMFCSSGCSSTIGSILGYISILGMVMASILPLASYIWGIVECIQIFTGKYQKSGN